MTAILSEAGVGESAMNVPDEVRHIFEKDYQLLQGKISIRAFLNRYKRRHNAYLTSANK